MPDFATSLDSCALARAAAGILADELAQAATLEACRDELASTLEDWLLFRIARHLPIPVLQGLDLEVKDSPAFA